MQRIDNSGIWERFIPGVFEGHLYKYAITWPDGTTHDKADPYGNYAEMRPGNASRITNLNGYEWGDLKEVGTQSADEKGSDEDKSEQMVVICSEAVDVEVPGSVWYLSDNASVDASGIVTVGQSDGYSVIIYK